MTAPAATVVAASPWASRRAGARVARARTRLIETSRSARGEPAVDDQLGTGHVGRVVAGQEQGDGRDLARLGDAADRDARLELLTKRVGEVRRLQRGVDDARVDDVAADAVL